MCKFFSLISDGNGKACYFDAKLRADVKQGLIKVESPDSHTSIADYYGFKGSKEDTVNKWEYNPITRVLTEDNIAVDNDKFFVEKVCQELDFKEIIPQLNIKKIINPFIDRKALKVTKKDLHLLKEWDSVSDSVRDSVMYSVRDSVWDSVRDSVWDSVGDSVWDSVGDSVWDSVWYSVWDSVRDSVWYSVMYSVGDSVRDSVWYSVRDSVRDSARNFVGAYIGSFFDIDYKINLTSSNKLWDKGLVPSFDGALWRLHGKNGKIIYTITQEKLRAMK